MTNPENLSDRLDDIDQRLDQLGDELDLIRTIQDGMRRETRATSQTAGRLERTVRELADIARLHQQALRQSQTETERIWQYLLRQQGGNGNSP
ncbi:hypothetical protein [Nostoc sp. MG11]|uniref:hypothetical protein n=1 Tax=Nostoc sp. MG11 TaxID=2721166 RepID=UPI0018689C6D|nr:hypothetical protein [Nostoc sp. MG11]